jgi:FAD:protein FMN transferase
VKLPVVPILLLAAMLLSSCARDPEIVLSGPTMGTTYTVRVVAAPPAVTAARLREMIDDVLASIDRQMSGYRPDSELARFNASTSTEWFEVSADMVAVIDTAASIAERSGGVLDITVAPLVSLWGFGPGGEAQELPQQSALQAARARVGYLKLHTRTEPPAVRKDIGDLTIDLNAVAPGYAVDLLMQRLAALGIQHCMVDVGGEIRAQGRNHRGAAWRIAVEKPQDAKQGPNLILELDDKAVATSGEYRHFFVRDGRRYSHTIDPRTAHPVDHDLASVTVVSATALEADGWATALNVLGPDQGYELAARLEIPALFTQWKNGTLQSRSTPQFDAYVAVKPQRERG